MNEKERNTFKLGHGTFGVFQIPLTVLVGLVAIAFIDRPPLWYGMFVCALGEAIQVWSASHLRKDKQLATSGPYSHVRNPMYFGRFFVGLGVMLMIKNPWVIAGYVVLFITYVTLRVSGEEARLVGYFGADYTDYCENVPRFRPRLTPYAKSAGQRAKWEFFTHNHEYRNVIGILFMFAVVTARVYCFPHFRLFR